MGKGLGADGLARYRRMGEKLHKKVEYMGGEVRSRQIQGLLEVMVEELEELEERMEKLYGSVAKRAAFEAMEEAGLL